MKKYICDVCGWEYDPEIGVADAGICPLCGVGKDEFSVSE